MDIYKAPRGARITDAEIINTAIASDLRERRIGAGVTLETLADLFNEKKASSRQPAKLAQLQRRPLSHFSLSIHK